MKVACNFLPGTSAYTVTGSTVEYNGTSGKAAYVFLSASFLAGGGKFSNTGNLAIGDGADGTVSGTEFMTLPVQHTPSGFDGGGWNLVGNPYPSAIQWGPSGWDRTNVDATVHVWRREQL